LMAAGRFHRPAGGARAVHYRNRVRKHLNNLATAVGTRP
jgi:hypothetical protein